MHSDDMSDSAGGINFSDIFDTVLQRKWLVGAVFLTIFVCGVLYAFVATPIYQADSLIQIEDNKSSASGGIQEIANVLGAGSSPVSGEVEILRSREVVMKAIQATRADVIVEPVRFPIIGSVIARRSVNDLATPFFGLTGYAWGGETITLGEFTVPEEYYGHPFILRATSDGYVVEDEDGARIGEARVGEPISRPLARSQLLINVTELKARPGTEFVLTRISPVVAYRNIVARLVVAESGKQSNVIRVSFEDPDLNFAQRLVNAISSAYLKQNVERRSAEADQSLQFLQGQLPEIKANVERAENALNKFRTATNTVNIDKATDALLGQAVDVEKSRLELMLKRDEMLQRFRPEHPLVRSIDAQLAATNQAVAKIGEEVQQLPAAQRDLLRLQRDAEVTSQLYITLLNNVQQLKVAKAGTTGNVRIVDFAVRDNRPVAPKKAFVIAFAGVLGLILGFGAAILARVLRPTLSDPEEIERATGMVSFVTVPESRAQEKLDSSKRGKMGRGRIVEGRSQLLALMQPADPAIESLRSFRTGLAFALMGANDKNIVITGATEALGKSFISANLSVLLAAAGKKVLLIETDMRKPQLGTYFGYNSTLGLSDYLVGTVSIEQVIKTDDSWGTNLDVLPAGSPPPNPGELLLSDRFKELITELQQKYDHILLDSAPVLPVGDTLAVARCASTTFLVVRADHSTVREVRDAVRKLESAGVAVKGFIFNGIQRRGIRYGTYKYYYGYGDR